jgi:hypothetical protein
MLISQAFPSEFLKAEDLQGHEVRCIMNHVEMRDVGDDYKPVLYFQGKEKGLVLNITNSNTLAAIYGDDTEEWRDKEIMLFVERVDFKGKKVPALRVRAPQPRDIERDMRTVNPVPVRQVGNGTTGRTAVHVPISTERSLDDVPF